MVLISISNLSLAYDGLRIANPFRFPERLRFKALEIDDFTVRDREI